MPSSRFTFFHLSHHNFFYLSLPIFSPISLCPTQSFIYLSVFPYRSIPLSSLSFSVSLQSLPYCIPTIPYFFLVYRYFVNCFVHHIVHLNMLLQKSLYTLRTLTPLVALVNSKHFSLTFICDCTALTNYFFEYTFYH